MLLLLFEFDASNPDEFRKKFRPHLKSYFKYSKSQKSDIQTIQKLHSEIDEIVNSNASDIASIQKFKEIVKSDDKREIAEFADYFWGSFQTFSDLIDQVLKKYGIAERIKLLHHTAANFRRYGSAFGSSNSEEFNYDNIYVIASLINRIIKGSRSICEDCHIVIDSLRNSSEINYFKERYSGFYLVAVKSDERKKRLLSEYDNEDRLVDRLLELDDIEYKVNDFVVGKFFSPDVQNCIQKADFHLVNNASSTTPTNFKSISEQLLKLQGLIQQPGLITPDSIERCMQLAYNAKLSSGCISRQVGAVITDSDYSTKAVGWNDVPKGAVPCSMRNVFELEEENPFGFTDFELGQGLSEGAGKSNPDDKDVNKESLDFNKYVKESYLPQINASSLGGVNCSFCFKTAYNTFKGDKNQVHTRSLHAEENAMLQITKYGGQAILGGVLFTTASPCELCSKKAYQLGIKNIYYIDPYPGISRSQVLKQSGNDEANPTLHMFQGAIGKGYIRLYEPFLSQKDEISILTGASFKKPETLKKKENKDAINLLLESDDDLLKTLKQLSLNDSIDEKSLLIELIRKGIQAGSNQSNNESEPAGNISDD